MWNQLGSMPIKRFLCLFPTIEVKQEAGQSIRWRRTSARGAVKFEPGALRPSIAPDMFSLIIACSPSRARRGLLHTLFVMIDCAPRGVKRMRVAGVSVGKSHCNS